MICHINLFNDEKNDGLTAYICHVSLYGGTAIGYQRNYYSYLVISNEVAVSYPSFFPTKFPNGSN